jgi:uncharacterized repeat protein (TIGR01451 family)
LNFMSVPRLSMALALAGLATTGLAAFDASREIEPTPLIFSLTGADLGVFPVIIQNGDTSALTYDLATGIIEFTVGIAGSERYTNPMFCFDLSGNLAPPVSLQTLDANGDVVISGFGLGSAFNYLLSNDEIRLSPPAQSQCFYRSATTGDFGLFGRAPAAIVDAPAEMIHSDRFQTTDRISVEYVNLPAFLIPGEALTYQVVISNEGTSNLHNVAFQELYPRNPTLYSSSLTAGAWTCQKSGGNATCPASSSNAASMRFTGLDLPVGSALTFNVSRQVHSDSLTSSIVDLRAGVVAGSGNSAPFDVAEQTITIIGEAQNLVAQQDASARAGELATIEVTALDANKLPVPFVQVDVVDDGGMSMSSTTEVTSSLDGIALFEASATGAGSYTIEFSAEDMGTTSATVTIRASDPANIEVSAASVSAIADGKDTFVFDIQVEDQFQNPVPAKLVTVADAGGLANISSADPYTDIDGMTSFSGSSTDAGEFTVVFSVDDVLTDSATASFEAGAPAAVVFEQQPTDTMEGVAMSPPVVVRILDANGNWVDTDSQSDVTLRLLQDGVLRDVAFGFGVAENGEVVFENLTPAADTAGTGYTLRAVGSYPDGSLSSVTSDTFVVIAP